MSEALTEADVKVWEASQPLRFALVDGRPARLPEHAQSPSRLARVRLIAGRVLTDEAEVAAWLGSPQAMLGSLEPEALAADGEEGCELVLRELVKMGRRWEAAGG